MERLHSCGDLRGQRGLFAARGYAKGEVILTEEPLVLGQHLFNRTFGYVACAHCLKSLETAREMTERLSDGAATLPTSATEPACTCQRCGERYCSPDCRNKQRHLLIAESVDIR